MVLGAPALAEIGVAGGGRDVIWLPYHRFSFDSSKSQDAALEILSEHLEPRRFFRWRGKNDGTRFQGEIDGAYFRMTRIMGYRNSFTPVTIGEIAERGAGSRIIIRMRMLIFPTIFMVVWSAGIVAFTISGFVDTTNQIGLIGVPMLIFGYALVMGCFWYEASKQEATLRALFD